MHGVGQRLGGAFALDDLFRRGLWLCGFGVRHDRRQQLHEQPHAVERNRARVCGRGQRLPQNALEKIRQVAVRRRVEHGLVHQPRIHQQFGDAEPRKAQPIGGGLLFPGKMQPVFLFRREQKQATCAVHGLHPVAHQIHRALFDIEQQIFRLRFQRAGIALLLELKKRNRTQPQIISPGDTCFGQAVLDMKFHAFHLRSSKPTGRTGESGRISFVFYSIIKC